MITHIAFDADDTLWHEIDLFKDTEDEFVKLLLEYHDEAWIREHFDKTNIKNLKYFGYGLKGFTLSLIETAIQLSDFKISARKIHHIIELAKKMSQRQITIFEHVIDNLKELQKNYTLMLLTKGDLFDQESKIARSGIADYFDIIEIMPHKTDKSYSKIFKRHDINAQDLIMIGNSIKSDINPIINLGGNAIHIPYESTWSHEEQNFEKSSKIIGLSSMQNLLSSIKRFE